MLNVITNSAWQISVLQVCVNVRTAIISIMVGVVGKAVKHMVQVSNVMMAGVILNNLKICKDMAIFECTRRAQCRDCQHITKELHGMVYWRFCKLTGKRISPRDLSCGKFLWEGYR